VKDFLKTLLLGFLAGVLISVGCVVFLTSNNKYIGALAFSCGLFFICERGYKLYTGAIGYALENNKKDNFLLLPILIGNFLGTLFMVLIIGLTRIESSVAESALNLVNIKLEDKWYSVLILSSLCGMLVYLGVDTFKKSQNPFSKVMAIIYCVFVFIISSYEHSIANMFYIMASHTWSLKAVLYVLIMVIGNSIGGLFLPLIMKIVGKLN